jgi:arylsulfatase A-like enzyme
VAKDPSGAPGGDIRRPNIVFFFTDDQRFDTVAALGNRHIVTPTLDALVAEGTAFTNGYIMGGSCPAVCMPSRAMLLTGRTLYRIRRQGQTIPDEHVLLGEHLRRAGYQTFGTGKWHNGTGSYARSFSAGAEIFFGGMFDHWNVPACDFDPTGRYDVSRPACVAPWRSNELRYDRCDHVSAGKHSSELFCDAAVDFINGYDADAPFFAYISFMAPHDPRTMPREFLDMYDPQALPLPENFLGAHPFDNGELKVRDELLADWPRTPEAVRRHLADYYAMISHADAQMARVVEALRAAGLYENTLIVFAGDNGLALGRHGLMGKQNLYDHSVHVPLVFAGPGVPRGRRCEAPCYLLDIFPTLCDLAGLDTPASVEGRSLVPALNDPAHAPRDRMLFAYRDVQRAVADERWKLIEYAVAGRRTTQLFDRQADPFERDNRADDPACRPHLRRLRGDLRRWRDELDDPSDAFWSAVESEA